MSSVLSVEEMNASILRHHAIKRDPYFRVSFMISSVDILIVAVPLKRWTTLFPGPSSSRTSQILSEIHSGLELAQILGLHFEWRRTPTMTKARAECLVDHLLERLTCAANFRPQLRCHIIIQSQGCSHPLMLRRE